MSDTSIMIINARMPDEFTASVQSYLSQGNWRVAETEMSVADHHYWAMLIREKSDE